METMSKRLAEREVRISLWVHAQPPACASPDTTHPYIVPYPCAPVRAQAELKVVKGNLNLALLQLEAARERAQEAQEGKKAAEEVQRVAQEQLIQGEESMRTQLQHLKDKRVEQEAKLMALLRENEGLHKEIWQFKEQTRLQDAAARQQAEREQHTSSGREVEGVGMLEELQVENARLRERLAHVSKNLEAMTQMRDAKAAELSARLTEESDYISTQLSTANRELTRQLTTQMETERARERAKMVEERAQWASERSARLVRTRR